MRWFRNRKKRDSEIEKQAYEQIGRLLITELSENKPFAKEFKKRKIGDKIDRIALNYLIEIKA